jgi:hypothetical protein
MQYSRCRKKHVKRRNEPVLRLAGTRRLSEEQARSAEEQSRSTEEQAHAEASARRLTIFNFESSARLDI